jgi:predicted TIM-barrel enzyme
VGINVLRNDAQSAIAIATCVHAQFIRVNVLTGIMATDQGLIEGQAHQLLRYRRELGSDVKILADVLVKHARPLGSPNLTTAVQETIERGLADGVIVSSSLKRRGKIEQPIDPIRVSQFVEAARRSVAEKAEPKPLSSVKLHS